VFEPNLKASGIKELEWKPKGEFLIQASIPESCEYYLCSGRSSDLLPFRPAFPFAGSEQWLWMNDGYGAYSCGTVPELHRVPF